MCDSVTLNLQFPLVSYFLCLFFLLHTFKKNSFTFFYLLSFFPCINRSNLLQSFAPGALRPNKKEIMAAKKHLSKELSKTALDKCLSLSCLTHRCNFCVQVLILLDFIHSSRCKVQVLDSTLFHPQGSWKIS